MSAQHTPGPWTIGKRAIDLSVSDRSDYDVWALLPIRNGMNEVAFVFEKDTDNARLIAAAPDLLAALQRSLNWLSSYPGEGALMAWEQARAAIAKAEGR